MSIQSQIKDIIQKLTTIWDSVLLTGLRLPFAVVDRDSYLKRIFKRSFDKCSPVNVLPKSDVKKASNKAIVFHCVVVSAISFFLAIPQTGWPMYTACAIDFIQFQIVVFILTQKLIFIYGNPKSETHADKKVDGKVLISLGNEVKHDKIISRTMTSLLGMAVSTFIKRMAQKLIVRVFLLNLFKQASRILGLSISKDAFDAGLDIAVAITCAIVCAAVSYVLFYPMMKRLQRGLYREAIRQDNDL
ncbi:MAG: hypothetical protein IJ263_07040 [Paludibacteraceae bacterium]|jgi:hypothetical protein|nr:hypothetical protein [Paludibacteraceae bacterium]MBR6111522.1 hypothetical protein [Paludibacteraceae bacterium]MBS7363268.1 hypothetical protein [Paludibacteraceae bacterium]